MLNRRTFVVAGPILETLLPRLEAMVRGDEFDPARNEERFRMALTDHACMVLLPSLVGHMREAAPRVRLEVSAWRTEAYDDAIAGRLDTALSAEEVPRSLQSEIIFNLNFVCVVGSALKTRTRRFTMKEYLQLPHALVETFGGQQTLVDRPLAQRGFTRQFVLSIPCFVPAIYAIAQTDLVLTVPRKLAKITAGIAGVRVVEPPRELKAFPCFMAWHPRLSGEPAHSWFREQIRLAARGLLNAGAQGTNFEPVPLREASVELGADHLAILQTRSWCAAWNCSARSIWQRFCKITAVDPAIHL